MTPGPPAEAPRRPGLLDAARGHGRGFAIGALLLIVSNACAAAIPQLIRGASNAILASASDRGMLLAGAIVAAALCGALARISSRISLFNAARHVEYDLRARLLAHLHTLGPSFFRRMSAGEIMSRATNDLAQVRLVLGFGALNLVNAALAYTVNLPLMLWRSPKLALAALAPYPLFVFAVRGFAGSLFRRSLAAQQTLGAMSDRVQQSLAGVRVVRAYGLERVEQEAFEKLSDASLRANLALTLLRGAMMPIGAAAGAVASLVVVGYGGRLIIGGQLTIGDLLAFQGHLALVAWPTIAMGYVFSIVQRGRASFARVEEILAAEPDVDDSAAQPLSAVQGALRVEGLSYRQGERTILDDVTFALPAGGSLAIVGRTGSGKSTLAQLLARMLPVPPGRVFLDERDITTLPLGQLRAAICLAQQEPFLFSTTIARNVAFSVPDPDAPESFERARDAAREAQILEEAEAMPDGLDTIVGERGVQLSGGQKQRVALARALLGAPRVLILDDPLSAVDARTEAAILGAIDRAAQGRTLVLVTHRVAAAARCDAVLVLEEGRVAEFGTPAALLANAGFYARLAERQALEAELEAM